MTGCGTILIPGATRTMKPWTAAMIFRTKVLGTSTAGDRRMTPYSVDANLFRENRIKELHHEVGDMEIASQTFSACEGKLLYQKICSQTLSLCEWGGGISGAAHAQLSDMLSVNSCSWRVDTKGIGNTFQAVWSFSATNMLVMPPIDRPAMKTGTGEDPCSLSTISCKNATANSLLKHARFESACWQS